MPVERTVPHPAMHVVAGISRIDELAAEAYSLGEQFFGGEAHPLSVLVQRDQAKPLGDHGSGLDCRE
jgi:hypothetical protein